MESSQSGPQKLTFANHPRNTPRSPPGPQLWAIVLSIAGLYYVWTKILGRPLPSFLRSTGGHRVRKGHSAEEMAAARERQQQRLQMASVAKNEDSKVRERNVNSGNGATGASSVQQQLASLQQSQAEKQKQKELEEKKRKQRQLYLRKKAEMEKAEEERRKDEELGPGWRYRQDPSIGNSVNSMNPQAGSDGGGYKPQTCTRRGG